MEQTFLERTGCISHQHQVFSMELERSNNVVYNYSKSLYPEHYASFATHHFLQARRYLLLELTNVHLLPH